MPHILLKKTFKTKPSGFQVANEKAFTFHGGAMTRDMIQVVNGRLSTLNFTGKANKLQFGVKEGHFFAEMNHDCQKYNEEDALCVILDCMQEMGYTFRFQYDQELDSVRTGGSSFTKREVFIFSK